MNTVDKLMYSFFLEQRIFGIYSEVVNFHQLPSLLFYQTEVIYCLKTTTCFHFMDSCIFSALVYFCSLLRKYEWKQECSLKTSNYDPSTFHVFDDLLKINSVLRKACVLVITWILGEWHFCTISYLLQFPFFLHTVTSFEGINTDLCFWTLPMRNTWKVKESLRIFWRENR